MEIGLCYKVNQCICLDGLQKGETFFLKRFTCDCPNNLKKWFIEHGFVKGSEISVHAISPFEDPVAYHIHNSMIVLRKDETKYLEGFVL